MDVRCGRSSWGLWIWHRWSCRICSQAQRQRSKVGWPGLGGTPGSCLCSSWGCWLGHGMRCLICRQAESQGGTLQVGNEQATASGASSAPGQEKGDSMTGPNGDSQGDPAGRHRGGWLCEQADRHSWRRTSGGCLAFQSDTCQLTDLLPPEHAYQYPRYMSLHSLQCMRACLHPEPGERCPEAGTQPEKLTLPSLLILCTCQRSGNTGAGLQLLVCRSPEQISCF